MTGVLDICGAIECQAPTWHRRPESLPPDHVHWWHVMDLATLEPEGDRDIVGRLFGVPEAAGFHPIAAGRGLPEDASVRTRERHQSSGSPGAPATWLTYAEVAGADWAEPALCADGTIPAGSRWRGVLQVMEVLANARSDEAVRLVVWFD